ncbi:hypothetical protein AT246_05170 [Bartonella henselae]|uniref:Uncharacterized protein n=1 Tax=Bartonella henselae TaxID=38323 RepID=X5M023_BARHN|nr:hypothetical protein [Bartonella henselae]MDM9996530.1 hypothetical protein [Bartonella henselae]OLL49000.1 hypothetical protein AT241_01725 [Bartonella henselae]OLL49528.1 hypothetical protein AT243_02650 [Bartonella henselae]OLL50766.1 hypothetical protein AT247_05205 [Bartonella henselae]OLL58618.1 hypothetical protein AT246_05170 [Bartonella henselae]
MEPFKHRIVVVLFAFLIFAASLFISRNPSTYLFLFNRSFSSNQVSVVEELILERLEVSFPDIIMKLSKLNPQQQKQLIEQVYRDIVAIASANGQSIEQARKLGEAGAMVLSRAISRGAVSDAYF